MDRDYIEWELLFRRIHGEITPEEEARFMRWWNAAPRHRDYFRRMEREWQSGAAGCYRSEIPRLIREFDALMDSRLPRRRAMRRRAMRYAAVIALLAAVGGGVWFSGVLDRTASAPDSMAIAPGGEKAVLIVGNGRKVIDIHDMEESAPVSVDGVSLTKRDGMISYADSDDVIEVDDGGMEAYNNTIMIPRGGEYKLQLADGTRVWLNSETSLTFPTGAKTGERWVYLQGEAYFEVAPDPGRPFVVRTDLGYVKVYGTQFNVKRYPGNDYLKATLVEGSIGYTLPESDTETKLTPGHQILYHAGDSGPSVRHVNVDNETAWRSSMLSFEKESLSEIMASLARWYDLEVVFESEKARDLIFSGSMNRYTDFYSFVELFEASALIEFEIRGRHVTIRAL